MCGDAVSALSRRQLRSDAREVLPLEAREPELILARPARTVAAADGAGTARAAARDLVEAHLFLRRIRQADDDHAEVQQGRVERCDGRLLPAVLRGGAGEDAAGLADQRAGEPQLAGLVDEIAQLRRHHAVARGAAEENAIVVAAVVGVCDGRLLLELDADLLRLGLRNGLAHALRHGLTHQFDMPVHAVIKHQYLAHDDASMTWRKVMS